MNKATKKEPAPNFSATASTAQLSKSISEIAAIATHSNDYDLDYIPRAIYNNPVEELLLREEGASGRLRKPRERVEPVVSRFNGYMASQSSTPTISRSHSRAGSLKPSQQKLKGAPTAYKATPQNSDEYLFGGSSYNEFETFDDGMDPEDGRQVVLTELGLEIIAPVYVATVPPLNKANIANPADDPVDCLGRHKALARVYPRTVRMATWKNTLAVSSQDVIHSAHASCIAMNSKTLRLSKEYTLRYQKPTHPSATNPNLTATATVIRRSGLSFRGRGVLERNAQKGLVPGMGAQSKMDSHFAKAIEKERVYNSEGTLAAFEGLSMVSSPVKGTMMMSAAERRRFRKDSANQSPDLSNLGFKSPMFADLPADSPAKTTEPSPSRVKVIPTLDLGEEVDAWASVAAAPKTPSSAGNIANEEKTSLDSIQQNQPLTDSDEWLAAEKKQLYNEWGRRGSGASMRQPEMASESIPVRDMDTKTSEPPAESAIAPTKEDKKEASYLKLLERQSMVTEPDREPSEMDSNPILDSFKTMLSKSREELAASTKSLSSETASLPVARPRTPIAALAIDGLEEPNWGEPVIMPVAEPVNACESKPFASENKGQTNDKVVPEPVSQQQTPKSSRTSQDSLKQAAVLQKGSIVTETDILMNAWAAESKEIVTAASNPLAPSETVIPAETRSTPSKAVEESIHSQRESATQKKATQDASISSTSANHSRESVTSAPRDVSTGERKSSKIFHFSSKSASTSSSSLFLKLRSGHDRDQDSKTNSNSETRASDEVLKSSLNESKPASLKPSMDCLQEEEADHSSGTAQKKHMSTKSLTSGMKAVVDKMTGSSASSHHSVSAESQKSVKTSRSELESSIQRDPESKSAKSSRQSLKASFMTEKPGVTDSESPIHKPKTSESRKASSDALTSKSSPNVDPQPESPTNASIHLPASTVQEPVNSIKASTPMNAQTAMHEIKPREQTSKESIASQKSGSVVSGDQVPVTAPASSKVAPLPSAAAPPTPDASSKPSLSSKISLNSGQDSRPVSTKASVASLSKDRSKDGEFNNPMKAPIAPKSEENVHVAPVPTVEEIKTPIVKATPVAQVLKPASTESLGKDTRTSRTEMAAVSVPKADEPKHAGEQSKSKDSLAKDAPTAVPINKAVDSKAASISSDSKKSLLNMAVEKKEAPQKKSASSDPVYPSGANTAASANSVGGQDQPASKTPAVITAVLSPIDKPQSMATPTEASSIKLEQNTGLSEPPKAQAIAAVVLPPVNPTAIDPAPKKSKFMNAMDQMKADELAASTRQPTINTQNNVLSKSRESGVYDVITAVLSPIDKPQSMATPTEASSIKLEQNTGLSEPPKAQAIAAVVLPPVNPTAIDPAPKKSKFMNAMDQMKADELAASTRQPTINTQNNVLSKSRESGVYDEAVSPKELWAAQPGAFRSSNHNLTAALGQEKSRSSITSTVGKSSAIPVTAAPAKVEAVSGVTLQPTPAEKEKLRLQEKVKTETVTAVANQNNVSTESATQVKKKPDEQAAKVVMPSAEEMLVDAVHEKSKCQLRLDNMQLACVDKKSNKPVFPQLELRRIVKAECTAGKTDVKVYACVPREKGKSGSKFRELEFTLEGGPEKAKAWVEGLMKLVYGAVSPEKAISRKVLCLVDRFEKEPPKLVEKYMKPVWSVVSKDVEIKLVQFSELSVSNAITDEEWHNISNVIVMSTEFAPKMLQILVRNGYADGPADLPVEADPVDAALTILKSCLGKTKSRQVHSEVEETIKRLSSHKGVEGIVIVNMEGIPIRTTLEPDKTIQHAALITQLAAKARSVVRDLDPQNDLTFLRIRSKKHEIMVAPDKDYILIVLQNPHHT
ncbi:Dynein light chain roadblock-type 2 [Chytriomyces hyalinus]|nr:Dynein light chain roadblock-type 2 [Chytriomyces hyalinus]